MAITADDVGFASYRSWNGPVYYGSTRFVTPQNPTNMEKIMGIITLTEGGCFDAINMYDTCMVSTGLLQWCEAPYSFTSDLLGSIAAHDIKLLAPLQPALDMSNSEFKLNPNGKWRFYWKKNGQQILNRNDQTHLFLLNSTGIKNSWDGASKLYAKTWAACLANTLAQPEATVCQTNFSLPRIMLFATKTAKQILWDGQPDTGWVSATRTGYLSFAGNLPSVAEQQLIIANQNTKYAKWSPEWCINLFKQLTFGANIGIYPARYNMIRKPLEERYGIDLPDFATELAKWEIQYGTVITNNGPIDPKNPVDLQKILIKLGYDLGPSGADGIIGRATKDAILAFQKANWLTIDGVVGPKTVEALLNAYQKS